LEGKDFLFHQIPAHSLTVQNERLGVFLHPGVEFGENIRIFLGEVFGVAGENGS
jgi:hypothetical protein